jgi:hypothetical protein
MNAKENALRIINFDNPERLVTWPPIHRIYYHGCNHRDFDSLPEDCQHLVGIGLE